MEEAEEKTARSGCLEQQVGVEPAGAPEVLIGKNGVGILTRTDTIKSNQIAANLRQFIGSKLVVNIQRLRRAGRRPKRHDVINRT